MTLGICILFGAVFAPSSAEHVCLSATKFTAKSIEYIATEAVGDSPASVTILHAILDYDGENKMISYQATGVHALSGSTFNFTSVEDFKHLKSYTTGTGGCKEDSITRPFFGPCLQGNMTKSESYTIADGQVTVNVYNEVLNGTNFAIHITDSGQPFKETRFGQTPEGVSQFTTQSLTDVRMGVLSNPDLFHNPGCHGPDPIGKF